jgi:hypothetical protein
MDEKGNDGHGVIWQEDLVANGQLGGGERNDTRCSGQDTKGEGLRKWGEGGVERRTWRERKKTSTADPDCARGYSTSGLTFRCKLRDNFR